MPPFAEKESSLLAKLKKQKPQVEELENVAHEKKSRPAAVMAQVRFFYVVQSSSFPPELK